MFLAFLDNSGVPPGESPPLDGTPEEGDDEDARARLAAAASVHSRSRMMKSRSGGYAWLISLSIHCAVLVGGFFAFRSYLHQSAARPPAPQTGKLGRGLYVVTSADATDAIHSFWTGAIFGPGDSTVSGQSPHERPVLPNFYAEGHPTLMSLQDHSPAIGSTISDRQLGVSPSKPVMKPDKLLPAGLVDQSR